MFAWKANKSLCDSTQREWVSVEIQSQVRQCKCDQRFPEYMFISGCLGLVYVVVLICTLPDAQEKSTSFWVKWCFQISILVILIMMWVAMFTSNQNCGLPLWNFGLSYLVCFLIASGLMACNRKN